MGPVVRRPGEPLPRIPSTFVYPATSKGDIAFCHLCFEEGQFRDLSAEDVEKITWCFGRAFVEERPSEAIRLLVEPMLARWRAPELLSPLGRAYVKAGRTQEGRALLQEALEIAPNHPYVAIDREYLEGS
jgi:hypothetical protein